MKVNNIYKREKSLKEKDRRRIEDVEDTTTRKEYHNIDENLINKGVERHVIRSHTV